MSAVTSHTTSNCITNTYMQCMCRSSQNLSESLRHTSLEVESALVFTINDLYLLGGCQELCRAKLSCGHRCQMTCHVRDANHTEYKCPSKCTKVLANCGHPCPSEIFYYLASIQWQIMQHN